MAVLTVSNLGKSFGAVEIFSELSFNVSKNARIGLVGPNGVGKTTLLRILVGEENPTEGQIQFSRGVRVGYLPQRAQLHSERTLWQECLHVFDDLLIRQKELRALEEEMSRSHENTEELMEAYGKLQQTFEYLGGYDFETRIHQMLSGLGFSPEDEGRPVQQLSGGQRTRAYLTKILLEAPDLLLLDEPTNHLDIAAVEWLESFLKDWPGAIIIVSHDRYFLDQVATAIYEMTPALETYRGNYSAYLVQRTERYTRRLAEYEAQQEFIQKEEDYIQRNIAGQNTRQAKGRRRRLERMLEESKITPPPTARRKMHMQLDTAGRSGELVLRTHDLQVGYEDEGRPLFSTPDLLLKRRECAAIIGPNGAGKTTFLKTILEQILAYRGEVELGASLKIGYFAQAHECLISERTLMDEISAVIPQWLPAQIRDYLAKFLFTGEDVFKTVELLSGGERGRLALAILALQGANLLLLDEPTNHLDLPSQEILQTMLGEFNGTILLVSHDRFLIDALASQIWEVVPGQSMLRIFEGSYSEYKAWLQNETTRNNGKIEEEPKKISIKSAQSEGSTGISKNELQRLQKRILVVEEKISQLEANLAELEMQLQNPPDDAKEVIQLGKKYSEVQSALSQHMQLWEELALQLDRV
ncbi:MAG: ABC-F family ATP-binding cassette domain-containing protein, partial [Anaerolineaceae bacterium]|nr:ABC-F family ATP-binding cassette domain-containing protein [Anaerolineaceae bacterium]